MAPPATYSYEHAGGSPAGSAHHVRKAEEPRPRRVSILYPPCPLHIRLHIPVFGRIQTSYGYHQADARPGQGRVAQLRSRAPAMGISMRLLDVQMLTQTEIEVETVWTTVPRKEWTNSPRERPRAQAILPSAVPETATSLGCAIAAAAATMCSGPALLMAKRTFPNHSHAPLPSPHPILCHLPAFGVLDFRPATTANKGC